jgi:hypothetical protein
MSEDRRRTTDEGGRPRLELSILSPELTMDFGQRGVILTLNEV